ncbi:MAG: VWA domain-containing protein [Lachnospiraceae bacterium]|nr:VWA domain-containing protein [Lachnospiraceae bacterium]
MRIFNPVIPIPALIAIFSVVLLISVILWILSRESRLKSTYALVRRAAILGLAFVIALRPMREERGAEIQLSNLDVLFVLDTTLSMWAEDGPGGSTRFKTAKEDIKEIMEGLSGANFGLITFQNKAVVLAPFTQDEDTLLGLLKSIQQPDRYYAQGSRLDTPYYDLENMLISSDRKENRQTIVFFFSDGEVTASSGTPFDYEVLGELVDGGAVLGYGTEKGGTMRDEYGEIYDMQTFEKAVSCIDEDNLEDIADALGIDYIHRQKSTLLTPLITKIKAAGGTITERRFDYITYQDTYYKYVPYLAGVLLLELIADIRENVKVRSKHGKKRENNKTK